MARTCSTSYTTWYRPGRARRVVDDLQFVATDPVRTAIGGERVLDPRDRQEVLPEPLQPRDVFRHIKSGESEPSSPQRKTTIPQVRCGAARHRRLPSLVARGAVPVAPVWTPEPPLEGLPGGGAVASRAATAQSSDAGRLCNPAPRRHETWSSHRHRVTEPPSDGWCARRRV